MRRKLPLSLGGRDRLMNQSRRVVELYLDDSEASREQREVIGKIRRRFPNLSVQEFGLQSPQAVERGSFWLRAL